uniref:Glycosyltransferase family 92 protein n=1 Tax=Panagrellus redivivus TaxID=6233 RepID=A0A7E4W7M8_PANRE
MSSAQDHGIIRKCSFNLILKIQHAFKQTPIVKFILFPEWDDILIAYPEKPGPLTYYDMFSPLIQKQPQAASYSLDRFETTFLNPVHEALPFSLSKLISKVEIEPISVLPKIVIRPHLVASIWIHGARIFDGPYREEKTKAAACAHIHNTILKKDKPKPHVKSKRNDTFADAGKLASNFQSTLDRHSFEFKTSNYPFNKLFYEIIAKCYQKIGRDFKKKGGPYYCPTTAACKFEAQNVTVVKTKTSYKMTVTSGLATDNNGCL